jgi:hypothetical protein
MIRAFFLCFHAGLLFLRVGVRLRMAPFEIVTRDISDAQGGRQTLTSAEVLRVFRGLRRLCRILHIENECLLVSATLYRLCADPIVLKFGVAAVSNEIQAHAWVVWNNSLTLTTEEHFSGTTMLTIRRPGRNHDSALEV